MSSPCGGVIRGASVLPQREAIERREPDPGAVRVDEAGIEEAREGSWADHRVGAVREPEQVDLPVEDVRRESARDVAGSAEGARTAVSTPITSAAFTRTLPPIADVADATARM
jgi:hypothetical protein